MGIVAEILRVASSTVKAWKSAPGEAAVVKGPGVGGAVLEVELFGAPGVVGRPGQGARVVHIPITSKYRVGIAAHNYALSIEYDEGETVVYSSSADGQTLQATARLKNDGTIELNGDGESLVMHGPLNTALQAAIGAIDTQLKALGQAGVTLNISAAEAATLRTDG